MYHRHCAVSFSACVTKMQRLPELLDVVVSLLLHVTSKLCLVLILTTTTYSKPYPIYDTIHKS